MKTKLLLYCTKAKPYLLRLNDSKYIVSKFREDYLSGGLNGKIAIECECEVEKIVYNEEYMEWQTETLCLDELYKKTQLFDNEELCDYLGDKSGYALHLTNIKFFDKPLELSEFYNSHLNEEIDKLIQENETLEYPHLSPYIAYKKCRLTKAPQNMCWCFGENGQKYCLISIRPEWYCKIANGEKTIEVRRKILKGML